MAAGRGSVGAHAVSEPRDAQAESWATGSSLARAAALIAIITVAARVVGFARTAVFARTVGSGCVGSVYQTVNAIPNIVFDVVAGGMLSAAVVPLLAGPLTGGDRERAGRIAAALLCWCLVVLGALAVLLVLLAGPLSGALLGRLGDADGQCPGAADLGRQMLMLFAPQVVLYGIAVVLTGMLQAARRFAWPALAPLLSSVAVIVVYLWYGAIADPDVAAPALSGWAILLLAGGTTLGVAVLAFSQAPAAARLRLRLRWTLRFPEGASGAARAAALAGTAALAGQQLSAVVSLRLANADGLAGVVVVTALAQTVFLLPWAILAVPLATSAFPRLSALHAANRIADFRMFSDSTLGLLLTATAVGTAALFACAEPVAALLLDRSAPAQSQLAPTIAVFAIALPGWSLVAYLGRVLYAAGLFRLSGGAQVCGWVAAIGAQIGLAAALPERLRAPALAGGYAVGVTVAAGLLCLACCRMGLLSAGATLVRRLAGMLVAAGAGAAVGAAIGARAADAGIAAATALGALAATAAAVASVAVLSMLRDPGIGAKAVRAVIGR